MPGLHSKGTVDQLNRLVTNMDGQKDRLDASLQKAPENYRKLVRTGSYGSFFNYYICELKWRVTDLQGRTAEFPWVKQEREVHRALMLKYRGNKLIRTGFMGVVLAILIVLVGPFTRDVDVAGRRRSGIRRSSPTPVA